MSELEIIYQAHDFCIINKPANSVVHRTPGADKSLVLLQTLRDQLGKTIYPVHRLDNATTGCLAFAFSSEAAALLQRSLQSDTSTKTYLALMRGRVPESGIYNRPLTNDRGLSQAAETHFLLKYQFEDVSLVELTLKTGRRHQIRRHAAHAGHHIIGDVNYGKGWLNRRFRDEYGFHRMFLHCSQLRFLFSEDDAYTDVECPLDNELQTLLHRLRDQ